MMQNLTDVFQYEWAVRAFFTSSLVGIMCGVLGCFIMLRNMALIGDALSHAILPGVVVGFIIAGHSVLAFFTGSVIAGLITAVLITWIQRNVKAKEDAAIGIVFTSMFATGVIGISWVSRQQGVHLDMKDFLFGNVLGISPQDVWLTALTTAYVLICIVIFYRYLFISTFQPIIAITMGISVSTLHYFLMLLLSFAVVASLQSVGVILVIAMLIIPASAAYILADKLKNMVIISAIVGLVSTTTGLSLAIVFETTPGPAMTVTAAFFYAGAVFFTPQKGLIGKFMRRKRKRDKMFEEDILKYIIQQKNRKEISAAEISSNFKNGKLKINKHLRNLNKKNLITLQSGVSTLTAKGEKQATELVRAHRLWETYMVEKMGYTKEQIHDVAERYEHDLPIQIIEKVNRKLGYPEKDPHGSQIPQPASYQPIQLIKLNRGQKARVSPDQDSEESKAFLWQSGITAGNLVTLQDKNQESLVLSINGKEILIPQIFAEKVKVILVDE